MQATRPKSILDPQYLKFPCIRCKLGAPLSDPHLHAPRLKLRKFVALAVKYYVGRCNIKPIQNFKLDGNFSRYNDVSTERTLIAHRIYTLRAN